MAYEGLFGIGDAGNLNNRDLEKEFRDRELHMQNVSRFKEEQKKWEESRSKTRRENRDNLYDNYFDTGEVHVNYQPYIGGKIKEHHQWITENLDENGLIKDESLEEYRLREDKILQDVTSLKDRTVNYNATVLDMRTEGTNINLYKKSEDGTYLVDANESLFIQGLDQGNINPDLPVDLPSMKGTPEAKRGSETYIEKQKGTDGLLEKSDTRTTLENNIETTTSYYKPDRVDTIENNIYEQLNPNELYHDNGDVAKSEYVVDYMDESNQTNFFKKIDTGGLDDPNVLDPQSKVYNEGIADQYARWLAKDLTKDLREEKIVNQKYVKPSRSDDDDDGKDSKTILTQTDVDKYNSPQPSNNSYNGFVAAAGTQKSVGSQYTSTLPLAEMDIYVGPDSQEQTFEVPGGEPMTFEEVVAIAKSGVGEGATVPKAVLIKTMQLANGDFVGEYSIPGTNSNVLVSFDNMDSEPFKIVGDAKPSEHLKQFEYWKRRNELPDSTTPTGDPTEGSGNADAFDPFNAEEFKVSAYAGGNAPTVDGTIKLGPGKKDYTFENPLSQEDHKILWDSGVRKIVWKSVSKGGKDGQPSYSTRGILTIPYRTYMDPKSKDFNPGSMFTMDDILAIIQSKK